MKRKILNVLFALVLVFSFSLVIAVPAPALATAPATLNVYPFSLYAGATFGTAAWSTAQHHTGSSSVLLTHDATNAGSDYVQFVPAAGTTLADLGTANGTPDWSWWHYTPATLNNWSQIELRFTQPGGDPDIVLDVTAMPLQNYTGTATWVKQPLVQATTGLLYYGIDAAGNAYSWTTGGTSALTTVAGIVAAIKANTTGTDSDPVLDALVLTRVRVELWEASNRACYIDDITIKGTTYYGLIGDAVSAATAGDTISVAAGTYSAETSWPININASLTVQSIAGAATTIIDPGAIGQGAIAISHNSVTLSGFTIKQGTLAYDATHPQEHTVWVSANYTTILNNTIIGGSGNQACLYIGGRTANTPTGAVYGYQVSQPLGQTIQGNTFRYLNAGEGWGIFAYDLSDSLITGNTFMGDAAWTTNSVPGAPGTAIIIHKATSATGSPSPGGGYVVVENNTARYVKYAFLTFYSAYMYTDSVGYGYEQPEASTVDKVIVRNNTVQNCGTAVTFSGAKKSDAYGAKYADLTVGTSLVTIGPGNIFHNNGDGIRVEAPKNYDDVHFGCVLSAEKIVISYNNIYSNNTVASYWGSTKGYGVWNGTDNANQTAGAKTIAALYNFWGDGSGPTIAANNRGDGDAISTYVTYEPWLHTTQATAYGSGIQYFGYDLCVLAVGWNIWSTPIALDPQVQTWGDYRALGTGLDLAAGASAYYFNGSTQTFISVGDDYRLTPCDAIYIKMASAQTSPILYSPGFSAPSKTLVAGWNLVSASYLEDIYDPDITDGVPVDTAMASLYYVTGANEIGYSQVVSPATAGQIPWSFVRGDDIESRRTDQTNVSHQGLLGIHGQPRHPGRNGIHAGI